MNLNLRKARKLEGKMREYVSPFVDGFKFTSSIPLSDIALEVNRDGNDVCDTVNKLNTQIDYIKEKNLSLAEGVKHVIDIMYRLRNVISTENINSGITRLMNTKSKLEYELRLSRSMLSGSGEYNANDSIYMASTDKGSLYGQKSTAIDVPAFVGEREKIEASIIILQDEIEGIEDQLMVLNTQTTITISDEDEQFLRDIKII